MHCDINIKSTSHSDSAETVRVAVAEKGDGVNFCPTLLVLSFFLLFSFSYLFCVVLVYIVYSVYLHSHLLSFSLPFFCLHYFFPYSYLMTYSFFPSFIFLYFITYLFFLQSSLLISGYFILPYCLLCIHPSFFSSLFFSFFLIQ